MSTVNVNGKVYNIPNGKSISVINDKVFVDGKLFAGEEDSNVKTINITIEGNVDTVEVDSCNKLEINGDVNGPLITGGSATVSGNVSQGVQTGGSLKCGDIGGNVNAFGSVKCGDIKGAITSYGAITRS